MHPLRHIVLINFLNDINNFFKKNVRHYRPFGKEPWPCLNPVAKHYKMDVVTDIKITSDYKTREPVGTFSCYCGFIYSRKGPDETKDDRYRIGRIKEFGSEWEGVLKSYLNEGRYGLRELSRKMECDPKTILKYDKKMKSYCFDRSRKLEDKEETKDNSKYKIDMDEYKNIVLNAIKENPHMNRTQIRKLFGKQYNYVYKFEREWLEEILPAKRMIDNNKKEIVDWNKRDKEILELVQSKTKELATDTNIQRITLTRIGKELGILSLLEKSLSKLPMTKKFIDISTESVKDFQIRRSIQIIDKKLENDDEIRLWEVQKIAGIRTGPFIEIQGILKDYLDRGYQH